VKKKFLPFLLFGLFILAGCRRSAKPPSTTAPENTAYPSIDCTYSNPECPQLKIQGDEPYRLPNGEASNFSGFADPSLRADPVTGELWLAYSYPGIHVLDATTLVPSVDIHLAHSKDGGKTWEYDGSLWSSYTDTNKGGGGEAGYTDHEVANLLPVKNDTGVVWYAARLEYFIPERGGFKKRPFNSFRIQILQAASPLELANATPATLATDKTAPDWGVDVNLSDLAPDVKHCDMWNEPALYYENKQLYLALRCLSFSGLGVAQLDQSPIVVFATSPLGDVKSWQWKYIGVLADAKVGKELGAAAVTQIEIARSKDGKLLLILTPEGWSDQEKDFIHYGTKVLEIASMDPPTLARDASGNLIIHAEITASDQGPLGNGAATYDPTSTTGIVFTGRLKTQNSLIATLHATGLMP
jgi:hypothetical protein